MKTPKNKPRKTPATNQLFLSIDKGDLDRAWDAIEKGADLAAFDENGLTPLHRVVSNNRMKVVDLCEFIEMFIMGAKAEPNPKSADGTSVLATAAISQKTTKPIEYLLTLGEDVAVSAIEFESIKEIASPAVCKLVSKVVKKNSSVGPRRTPAPLTKSRWSSARRKINKVFQSLESQKIVCLQSAGFTQSDGIEDCEKIVSSRGGLKKSKIVGYCFYTKQDRQSAMETGEMMLSIWGAPKGGKRATVKIGKLVVAAFEKQGFEIEWLGTTEFRPSVIL